MHSYCVVFVCYCTLCRPFVWFDQNFMTILPLLFSFIFSPAISLSPLSLISNSLSAHQWLPLKREELEIKSKIKSNQTHSTLALLLRLLPYTLTIKKPNQTHSLHYSLLWIKSSFYDSLPILAVSTLEMACFYQASGLN